MRAIGVAFVATIASTTSVAAQPASIAPIGGPAVRKPVTDKYNGDALSKFVDGIIADKAGEFGDALRAYEQSNRAAPHANTYYNIGDVERRIDNTKRAVEAYRKYLELEPAAKDRAAVEKLIQELETGPVLVTLDGDEPDSIIFIDGKLIGPSPVTTRLPQGKHSAERITPRGMSQRTFDLRGGRAEHIRMSSSSREELGNVILATGPGWNTSGQWKDDARTWSMPGRNQLPPGRYETSPFRDRACTKLVFDVAPGDHLTYVYVDGGPPADGCIPITVKVTKIPKVVAR